MQAHIGSTKPDNLSTDLLVVGFHGKGGRRSPAWSALNRAIGGGLEGLLKIQGWSGKKGEFASFPAPPGLRARLVLVGSLGERSDSGSTELRNLATRAGTLARKGGLSRIGFYVDPAMDKRSGLDRSMMQGLGEGLEWGAYRFDRHQSSRRDGSAPSEVFLYFEGRKDRPMMANCIERGAAIGRAQNIARDLVNEPANVINPETIIDFARKLAEDKGLEITVLDEDECRKRGMNAFLAVGQGSIRKSALAHMVWRPRSGKPRRRLVLVGKAVTFDSGGMCIKSAAGQATMKMDMGGSAAVIGAMAAAADLAVDSEVHGIFAATENMTGSDAYHTGDVLTASNGKTIEVLNTDAEGRLTLADALTYACKLEPDHLVDLATLTGSCMVALGPAVAGIMGTGRGLIRSLRSAGDAAGEPLWELPMPDAYRELIQSKIADVQNTGGRYGGAITAGMFLREFVEEGTSWAHIDIAGPAFADKPLSGQPYGATGFPVRALAEWITHG